MSTVEITGLALALLIMCVGLLGSIIPALPSTPVVLAAAIVHKLSFGPKSASWIILGFLLLLTIVSLLLDQIVSAYGAKKFGASWKGILGAVLGGIVGLFFSLPGIILGPFIGAVLFEMLGRRTLKDSSRAGVGATVGLLLAAVAKLGCCVTMMAAFTLDVIY